MTVDAIPGELRDYFERSTVALSLGAAEGDHPLQLTNQRFHQLTGYGASEIIGRNCRFLQGESRNEEARGQIREFLADDRRPNVRTSIVNFRKDGQPFVNLLYIFASQFDISRTQPGLLAEYDTSLGQTLVGLSPVLADSGLIIEGSLMTIANAAATIAQAKLTLGQLDSGHLL